MADHLKHRHSRMTYSILLLGASTSLGRKVSKCLATHAQYLTRIAVLSPGADADIREEGGDASNRLEHIVGRLNDPTSYQGFDIVVSTIDDDDSAAQKEYFDAAIVGGVRHFYPAEYGADLTHELVRDQPYFADKISVREHLEAYAQTDASLGYTYLITGVSADLLLEANLLSLSEQKATATHVGYPDALVSVTHSDDVAQAIVASLLPDYLTSLNTKRHIRFAGSTLPVSALYDAISYVLRHPIEVTYQTPDASYESDKQLKGSYNEHSPKLPSIRRSLGLGAYRLQAPDGQEPGQGTTSSGKEYVEALSPKNWAQVVHEHFMKTKDQSPTMKEG
ncbi:hypothetical protein H2200_012105 [Cladophialophora chaetospira]|uniref:NmrA-like domain-containing protein n=1 Tax=Cladophialophora chaetospira TaxID=386627 RepID=A0AA38WYA1_9EURO|nr:hypothetical protein H2200_012105 [Cladophialophora chaetospira]